MPISIHLPPDALAHLLELAEITASYPATGPNAGKKPSLTALIRRIADSPACLESIAAVLCGTGGEPTAQIVRPERPVTETIAWIDTTHDALLRVRFPEKLDSFRGVVKHGFSMHWDAPHWQRKIDRFCGPMADRAAELGHRLLAAGFCVVFPAPDIRDMGIGGSYQPECRRWIKTCELPDGGCRWFYIWWAYEENCYDAAKAITGSRYSKPAVIVPPEHYDEVRDFAHLHGFRFSDGALQLTEQAARLRGGAITVDVPPVVVAEPPDTAIPELDVPEIVEIDDDLRED